MYISPIRCTGSKRKAAKELSLLFPEYYDIVFEPFVGGGTLFPYYKQNAMIYASDINSHVITWWKYIQNKYDREALLNFYESITNSKNLKDEYYRLREDFNATKSSIMLFVLSYLSFNNLIRFNSKGEFNVSFDLSGDYAKKEIVEKYINNYLPFIENVNFQNLNYTDTLNSIILSAYHSKVFCFFDPPYMGEKYTGIYEQNVYNKQEFEDYLGDLNNLGVSYMVTLGKNEELSEHLYIRKFNTKELKSTFQRYVKHSDSVYLNYL